VSAERYNDVPRWLSRLRDIRTALSDDSQPPQGRLRAAAEGVAFMYAGPRNFADFIIARDDPAEQVAVNQRLLDLMTTLRGLVRDE
jgi:hypothetical protein